MRTVRLLLVCFILCIFACATTGKLMRLELEMSKQDVRQSMGEPTAARGSITNKYGQVVEVWEYDLTKTGFSSDAISYWLFFCEGILVQWGEAGDWNTTVDRIYEVRFR